MEWISHIVVMATDMDMVMAVMDMLTAMAMAKERKVKNKIIKY